jgi:hypothetical protein
MYRILISYYERSISWNAGTNSMDTAKGGTIKRNTLRFEGYLETKAKGEEIAATSTSVKVTYLSFSLFSSCNT